MAPTVYRTPKWRAIVVIAAATGFVVYGILAAIVSPNVASILFGAVCVILFGYVAVLLTVQLARRRPELTLTEEGLTFRNWTLVEWSRIRAVAIVKVGTRPASQRMIAVDLYDATDYAPGALTAPRWMMRANEILGSTPINIPSASMPVPLDEVIAMMRRYHPTLVVLT
jgi:hypothetical protein